MCLIVFAWQAHPDYPLVVAANRDEYLARPAAPAHWWVDAPELLAGRDLEAGGTWMGLTRDQGREEHASAEDRQHRCRVGDLQGPSQRRDVGHAAELGPERYV